MRRSSTRVPLVISVPDGVRDQKCSSPVELLSSPHKPTQTLAIFVDNPDTRRDVPEFSCAVQEFHALFDYMAFYVPMMYSDFIGFANPRMILLHRLAYLLMGTGFIFATIRFLNRLPQTGRWNGLNLLGFIAFLSGGLLVLEI